MIANEGHASYRSSRKRNDRLRHLVPLRTLPPDAEEACVRVDEPPAPSHENFPDNFRDDGILEWLISIECLLQSDAHH